MGALPRFDVGDLSVIHVGDDVGKAKDPAVMGDHEDRPVRMHSGRGKQFHDGLARGVIECGGRLIANN